MSEKRQAAIDFALSPALGAASIAIGSRIKLDAYEYSNRLNLWIMMIGRSTRIWLDLMLLRSLKRCVDWSRIDKNEYLTAMRESVIDSTHIKALLKEALTDKINNREMFMKGTDYSYYYEEE